jgi:branched-chain amino acid transport system substrate-binding protein
VFLIAEAIKAANSTKSDDVIKALEAIKWTGARGTVTFSTEKSGYKYHQWLEVPYVTFQITAVKQPIADAKLVQEPGQQLNVGAIERPK